MNELIRELAEQCESFGSWDNKTYTFDKEKFAKLIVRECIGIAQDRAAFDWAPPNDVNHIINEIREHFGVES
jgi:hypothetical protein